MDDSLNIAPRYIANNWSARCTHTNQVFEALLVEYTASDGPHTLKMLNSSTSHEYLGITWSLDPNEDPQFGPDSYMPGDITGLSGATPKSMTTASRNCGKSRSKIWSVGAGSDVICDLDSGR